MLKYLVVLLSNKSVSYCSYDSDEMLDDKLISVSDLHDAIIFGMKENLMIQFVYPEETITSEHLAEINTIDHINIKPYTLSQKEDVGVINEWCEVSKTAECENVIVRTTIADITIHADDIIKLLREHKRVNISFKK